ncbi:MAG: Ig-like domain-containing protein [Parabacteroides sp.]|nr:Ig-like domain-containing protein [Parabacteroides sp.]
MKKTMYTRPVILLIGLIFSLSIISCQDEVVIEEIQLDKTEIDLKINESTTVIIKGGNGEFNAKAEDESIATVSVVNRVITIKAVKEGSTTVTVTDNKNNTATLDITVSYSIPTQSKFVWNNESVEFDKAGGYGISILSNSIALTDLNIDKKQYVLSWTGGLSEGEKSNGKLMISEQGKTTPETITLTSVKVVQAGISGNYIIFSDGYKSGDLLFYDH